MIYKHVAIQISAIYLVFESAFSLQLQLTLFNTRQVYNLTVSCQNFDRLHSEGNVIAFDERNMC